MTDFPLDVEAHCRRLAVQRRWPPETEAAFRATVAWETVAVFDLDLERTGLPHIGS